MEGLLSPTSTDEESETGKVEGLVHSQPARKWLELGLERGLPGSKPHFLTDPSAQGISLLRKLSFSGLKSRKVRKSRGIGVIPRESSYLHLAFAVVELSPLGQICSLALMSRNCSHTTRDFLAGSLHSYKVTCPHYFNRGSFLQHHFWVSHTWGLRLCAELLRILTTKPDPPPNGNTLLKPASISPNKWRFGKAQKPANGHTAEARLRPSSLVTNPHLSPPRFMFP